MKISRNEAMKRMLGLSEAVRIDSRCGARSLLLRFPRPKRKRIAIAALERMVRK